MKLMPSSPARQPQVKRERVKFVLCPNEWCNERLPQQRLREHQVVCRQMHEEESRRLHTKRQTQARMTMHRVNQATQNSGARADAVDLDELLRAQEHEMVARWSAQAEAAAAGTQGGRGAGASLMLGGGAQLSPIRASAANSSAPALACVPCEPPLGSVAQSRVFLSPPAASATSTPAQAGARWSRRPHTSGDSAGGGFRGRTFVHGGGEPLLATTRHAAGDVPILARPRQHGPEAEAEVGTANTGEAAATDASARVDGGGGGPTAHGAQRGKHRGKEWLAFGHPKPWRKWRATPAIHDLEMQTRVDVREAEPSLRAGARSEHVDHSAVVGSAAASVAQSHVNMRVFGIKQLLQRSRTNLLRWQEPFARVRGAGEKLAVCPGCGQLVAAADALAHETYECPGREMRCDAVPSCGATFRFDQREQHRRECPARAQRETLFQRARLRAAARKMCANGCGAVFGCERDALFHAQYDCPARLVTCPERACGAQVRLCDLAEHRRTECVPVQRRAELVQRAFGATRNRTTGFWRWRTMLGKHSGGSRPPEVAADGGDSAPAGDVASEGSGGDDAELVRVPDTATTVEASGAAKALEVKTGTAAEIEPTAEITADVMADAKAKAKVDAQAKAETPQCWRWDLIRETDSDSFMQPLGRSGYECAWFEAVPVVVGARLADRDASRDAESRATPWETLPPGTPSAEEGQFLFLERRCGTAPAVAAAGGADSEDGGTIGPLTCEDWRALLRDAPHKAVQFALPGTKPGHTGFYLSRALRISYFEKRDGQRWTEVARPSLVLPAPLESLRADAAWSMGEVRRVAAGLTGVAKPVEKPLAATERPLVAEGVRPPLAAATDTASAASVMAGEGGGAGGGGDSGSRTRHPKTAEGGGRWGRV
eukprot:g774.t1